MKKPTGHLESLTAEERRTLLKRRLAAATGGRTTWPASHAQQRLVFMDKLGAGGNYNAARSWLLVGPLDVDALARSLGEIARRHEVLRTCFVIDEDGRATQRVDADQTLSLERVDLGHLQEADRAAETRRLLAETAGRPFDLTHGPVGRACLVRWTDTDHVLLLAFHHIACDGWSFGLLFRELDGLYQAFVRGEPSPLAPLATPYGAHAEWERDALTGEELDRSLAYWKERLAGAPELDLPVDRRPTSRSTPRGDRVDMRLPAAATVGLRTLAREQRATLYMALLAAVDVLLARHCGQDDVVLGTPIANRRREETRDHIGFFVNMLAMRVDVSGNPSYRDLLSRAREVALGAYRHQDVPFERIVEELGLRHQLGRNPLFNVAFALQNASERELSLAGIEATPFATGFVPAHFDLSIHACESGDEILFKFRYDTTLFDAATIERLAGRYLDLLEAVASQPDRPLRALPSMPEDERRVLRAWSRTDERPPAVQSIPAQFADQVRATPDAPALAFEGRRLTYCELDRRSTTLARRLRSLGVGPDARVGLFLDRSAEVIVGMLAVMKAGGAYVPLDPAYPADRLAFMIEDAGARVLLTRTALRDELPPRDAHVVCVDGPDETPAPGTDVALPAVRPRDLAYVMYTSGSTGTPKGVEIEHAQLANYVHGILPRLDLPPGMRYGAVSTPAADLGNTAIFAALCSGGCLHVLAEERVRNGDAFAEYVRREAIDCIKIVPSHIEALLAAARRPEEVVPAKLLVLGGEACSWELVERLRELRPECALMNHYGPTETTVGVLTHRIEPGDRARFSLGPPIGRPIANTSVLVLDPAGAPVPIGAAGELYIGGESVARGYRDQPELTAARFVEDQSGIEPGGRLYRTGDLVRYLPDGQLHFLGRADDQVKIRGFRIELGEIEAVLGEHDGVREAVVAVHQDQTGDKQLAAYLVPQPEREGLVDGVRRSLRARLPAYMVPATFTLLDTLPLSPNGKVDRRALTTPTPTPSEQREFVAPRSGEEEVVASIFAEALGIERIGAHDDFFDLGGHSLKATQVVMRIQSRLGIELPLESLFDPPTTVARIAGHVKTIRWARDAASDVAPLPGGEEVEL